MIQDFMDLKTDPYRILPRSQQCQDCDQMVVDQSIEYQKRWRADDTSYWTKKCLICRSKTLGLDFTNK